MKGSVPLRTEAKTARLTGLVTVASAAETFEKAKPAAQMRLPSARGPAAKPDAGAKTSDSDAAKANQKRPGGLIEDVPF